MSKDWRELTGEELVPITSVDMRAWCSRPGTIDENGELVYVTEQSHAKECDVNLIIRKYDKTGLIDHITKFEARFGDLRGLDFKEAMDLVTNASSMFEQLPSNIRAKFDNTPEKLLEFMEKPENRAEAIELGLISGASDPGSDGLGEHVQPVEEPAKPKQPAKKQPAKPLDKPADEPVK